MTGEKTHQSQTQSNASGEGLALTQCKVVLEKCPGEYTEKETRHPKDGTGREPEESHRDEVLTVKPCIVVLQKLPPEYVEKVLQLPRDERGTDPVESDSDSGDSLFITQNPVPQPVRSRSTRHKLHLEEHEDDSSSSSSSSHEPSRRTKKKMMSYYSKLPQFNFPFLGKYQYKHTSKRNASLHDAGMIGFLRLVKELCEGSRTGEDVESSLPADGGDISPPPEEEMEESEAEDIKVVERKLFAVQLQSKRKQNWCNYVQQKNGRNAANAGGEPSQEKQLQASDEEPDMANTSGIEAEVDEPATRHGNSVQQLETQMTARHLEEEQEERDTPHSEQTMTTSKCDAENITLQVCGNLDSDFSAGVSVSSCEENGGTKENEKNRDPEDEEQLQSSTVPETQKDEANYQKKRKKRKKREEITTQEERREEGNSSEASQQTLESSFDKRKKKKRLSCDESAQEKECAGVSSVLASTENEEKSAKKKKRKKTNPEVEDSFLIPVKNTIHEHIDETQDKVDEDAVSELATKRKKKKRKKRESCSENNSEQVSVQGDDPVSVTEKTRSSSPFSADTESLLSVEAPVAVSETDKVVEESLEVVEESLEVKKKKKRKNSRKSETCCENNSELGNDSASLQERTRTSSFLSVSTLLMSADTESLLSVEAPVQGLENDKSLEESNDEVRKDKKRKKKRQDETCIENNSEPGLAQGDETVLLQEETRTSFLRADTESLPFVEAPVAGSENDKVVEESLEVKKKKKRRKSETCRENNSEFGNDSVSVQERTRTSSFLSADTESLLSVEAPVEGLENDRGVGEFSNEVRKKKKRKKKRQDETCIENNSEPGVAQGDETVLLQEETRTSFFRADTESLLFVEAPVAGSENDKVVEESLEVKKKKKRKNRRKSETCCENNSEPGDDSVSVQERTRTSSFLSADTESLLPVEAPVQGLDNDKSLEESNDEVRKKKKKKKRKLLEMHDGVEKDEGQVLEEPNTNQSALSEGDRPGVKRRKKHDRDELMIPVEREEGAVNTSPPFDPETVVLKKKKKKKSKEKISHVKQQNLLAATREIVKL